MKKSLIIAIATFISMLTFAQNTSWCGTQISNEWMQSFYNRNKDHLNHKGTNLNEVIIPITYHLVGLDNGTGYYELAALFRSHCDLQELYANANIRFYIESINYIDDTDYYNGQNTYRLFVDENNRNTCNVYIVDDMQGVCGYSFVPEAHDGSGWDGPNRGGIMLQKGCMQAGNTTYRHEMGHYLNLPHTFYGWEGEATPDNNINAPTTINGSTVERVARTNCLTSGDGFCDTPPDYISDRWTCNTTRTFIDPEGTSFDLDEKNFMSYSNDGCSQYLMDDQLAEVNAAPANHRPYLLDLPVPASANLQVITGMVPTNNSYNINPNNIIISWPKQAEADYYHIQVARFNFINPTFDVVTTDTFYIIQNPSFNSEYKYQVRPISLTNVCTDFSEVITFTTASYDAQFTVTELDCPNDFTGGANVLVNGVGGNYTYHWFNDINATSPIPNQSSNSLINLNTGEYSLIVIKNNNDTLFIPFVIPPANEINVDITQVGTTLQASISGGTAPYTYIWDNSTEDLVLTTPRQGINTFVVIDQKGCQKVVEATYDKNAVGINDVNENITSLSLIPNPIQTSNLKIKLNSKINSEIAITCTDLNGKTLMKQNYSALVGENNFNMDVTNLSNGIYFISIIQNGMRTRTKLVVSK